ncbi:MAG: TonB-dependent receptor [Gammaproteobacteria bacterium]
MYARVTICLLCFLSFNLYAEEQSVTGTVEIPEIVIESKWFPGEKPDDFAQSITILNGEELERKKSNSIGETVINELGVNATSFAPGASRPIIRGLGSNRVRVLENGIGALDASSLSEDHPVSIEPYFAKQIEILRGPSTLRFGPGAFGGVVNIINNRIPKTLKTSPFEVKAAVEHDTVSDGETAALELNGTSNNFAWHFDGLTRDTNDYDIDGFANDEEPENRGKLSNSDVETDNHGFGASYISDQGMIGFGYNRFDTNFGVPGAEEGDIRIDLKQYRYDMLAELYNPFSSIEKISLRSTYNNYRHFEIEESGEIATAFDNEELESRLEFIHTINDHWKNALGVQYNDREFAAEGEEAFIQPLDQERIGVFAVSHYHNELWDLEGGLRFDRDEFKPDNGDDEDFSVYSVSFGAQRQLSNDMQLNVFLARTERAPQETALYADGPHLATLTFETGSTDIDEETSYNFEIGLEQTKSSYSWAVNTYYNRINDFIYLSSVDANNDGIADRTDEDGMFELDGELLAGVYENEDAEFYGIEAEFVKQLVSNSKYDLRGRIFGDYVRAEFDDSDAGDVPRIPTGRLGLGLEGYRNTWSGTVDLVYVDDSNNEADLETDTDSYTMLNASLTKTFYAGDSDIKVFLRGENLLDEDARQHTSFTKDRVVLPGIGATLGVSLEFE